MSDSFHGLNLPEDWQKQNITGFRDIRRVIGSGSKDRFVGVPVTGDNLKHLHIVHGDILIVRLTNEFVEDTLCVWSTPKGRTAKFAYEDFDGAVVLHNKNGWVQKWQPEEIKLVGIVVRVERDIQQGKVKI